MTWDQIVAIEPRLANLHLDASICRRPGVSPYDVWYQTLKPRLVHLVGFGAEKPELRNCDCYDIAYDVIFAALSPPRKRRSRCVPVSR